MCVYLHPVPLQGDASFTDYTALPTRATTLLRAFGSLAATSLPPSILAYGTVLGPVDSSGWSCTPCVVCLKSVCALSINFRERSFSDPAATSFAKAAAIAVASAAAAAAPIHRRGKPAALEKRR